MEDTHAEASVEVPTAIAERTFPGTGEMAQLMRSTDWSKTPLGPVEGWSPSLRMMVRFLLLNRFPLLLWWGPEFYQLYNDPYRPVLGTKHPRSLGQPASECWAEIWEVIGPLIQTPFNGGPATWMEDIFLEPYRHGFVEETHFTIAYSPVPDEAAPNGIGGVLATVHEISDKVVAERRVVVLRDLGARAADAKTAEEACRIAAETLSHHPKDIPFALLYLIDPDGKHARLAATAGVMPQDRSVDPPVIPLGTEASMRPGVETGSGTVSGQEWQLTVAQRTESMQVVEDLASCFEAVPLGPWSDPPTSAVVMPIRSNIAHQLAGFLIAGVSARLRLDDAYVGFYELVSSQIATAVANARAYEEERHRAEALAAIDRAKTAFFSNVSHEFRTPLTLMLGPLEDSLADLADVLTPQQQARQQVIYRNGVRLLKLVNTLLDFARIEAGRAEAVYEPTDLAAYTADLASAFRSLIEKAGMALVVDCPPLNGDLSGSVYVDRDMWEKIVLNLLSNAFKFTFEGSICVALHAVDDGRGVELVVRDTGVGISAAELPRLFERFHRVEAVRSRTHEGSGIGLALVQELVHLHGGNIRAESAEGAGTTFFVRLPAGAAHLPADRVQASTTLVSTALGASAYVEEAEHWLPDMLQGDRPEETGGITAAPSSAVARAEAGALGDLRDAAWQTPVRAKNTAPARIVLADDNADMRDYLRRLLSERYTVEAVANGAQALAAIRRQRPDLVLADVMMPELDGFGMLRALRTDSATVTLPVMLLSARAGEEATIEGLAAGADDYLVKPFSAREVLSRVAARLEIARARQEAEWRLHQSLKALMSMAEALVGDVGGVVAASQECSHIRAGTPEAVDVQQAADSSKEPDSLDAARSTIHQLLGLTLHVLDSQSAGATYIDCETGAFDVLAVAGLTPEIEQRLRYDLSHRRMIDYYPPEALDRLKAEESVTFNFAEEPPISSQDYYGISNLLIVPSRMDAQRLLVVAVEARNRPAFTPQERDLAQAVARLVRLVVERERLLREREEGLMRELALTESKRRMDEFLGIASHELRTPIASIMANVQLTGRQLRGLSQQAAALESPDGTNGLSARLERSELLLERTGRQMVRLNRLISDLLDTSRIQAGKLEMRLEPCDLLEIVRDAIREQRVAWPDRCIELDLPQRAGLAVTADRDRIGQVVTNLLTNALKYSRTEQPVTVRVRQHGEVARVEVSDHGQGLTVEQQVHLFERYYRVPGIKQQSGSGVGLGLGLHICKTIIERHGGTMGVESQPGEGSTFWFTLPLAGPLHPSNLSYYRSEQL